MAEIPNTEYVTVKRDTNGEVVVLVGGKPEKYMYDIGYVKKVFAWMQEQNPDVAEFHICASATRGEWAKAGNPDGKFGPNAWCRVKLKNGSLAAWVFYRTYCSADVCAYYCASTCAHYVRAFSDFRAAVLDSAIDKGNTKNDNTQSGAQSRRDQGGTGRGTADPADKNEQFEVSQVIREGNLKITIERLKAKMNNLKLFKLFAKGIKR